MAQNRSEFSGFRERLITFVPELRIAIRSLSRTKGLTVTVILMLGIGANAAISSIVCGVLLRPLRDQAVQNVAFRLNCIFLGSLRVPVH